MAEGVLASILARKRSDVTARLAGASIDAKPTHRSLRAALERPGARFIMEVKKASPSGHRSTVPVAAAVEAYAPVADAISVLTDAPFFGGSLDDLRTARASFEGPILAKDFIVDPRQVAEARKNGADAVLAIMAALSDEEVGALLAEARRLSMDVIVEVHDELELRRALRFDAQIIGINNRDLGSLRTDLSTTERLVPLVPEDRTIVSESGIAARSDVERLGGLVDAFLVGSSLMRADDVAQAARRLLFGVVKICGLTNADDVRLAAAAGATHAGFIFVPETPRQVSANAAAPLMAEARRSGMRTVGVFRDQEPAKVSALAGALNLDAVQIHGARQELEALRSDLPEGCEIWAVSSVGDMVEPAPAGADRILFDTRVGNSSGGSGRAFDWSLVSGRPELPSAFLAGGIGPHNVRTALDVGAFGLDIGSAIEAAPGRKNPDQLRSLFDELRPGCRKSAQCV